MPQPLGYEYITRHLRQRRKNALIKGGLADHVAGQRDLVADVTEHAPDALGAFSVSHRQTSLAARAIRRAVAAVPTGPGRRLP
jgi:hypothetical protein